MQLYTSIKTIWGKHSAPIIMASGAVAITAFALYVFSQQSTPFTSLNSAKSPYTSADTYCAASGTAIVCQDANNKTTKKFHLPAEYGVVTSITPSPDGKMYVVQSNGNPLYSYDLGRTYITDAGFKKIKEIPFKKNTYYSAAAWAGNGTLALVKHTVTIDPLKPTKTEISLILHDVQSGKDRSAQQKLSGYYVLHPAGNGGSVFLESRGDKVPGLSVVDVGSGNTKKIDTQALLEKMQGYGTVGYDTATSTFYVSGSGPADDDRPVLAVGKVDIRAKNPKLTISHVVQDGYAYAPLQPISGGMLARRDRSGKTEPVILAANGTVSASALRPSDSVGFSRVGMPSLQAAQSGSLAAGDFVAIPADAPVELRNYLVSSLAQSPCPAGQFNGVRLLAFDSTQAAAILTTCGLTDATLIHYYSRDGENYRELATSPGTPTCMFKGGVGLSDIVAPTCVH